MAKRSRECIYGINPVFEVVRAGRRRIYGAYINETTLRQPRMRKLAGYLKEQDIAVQHVDKRRVTDLAGTRENQGVVIQAGTYPYEASEDLLGASRILLLDNVEDPHNVGAILRSAEIFGFKSVLMSKRGVPEIYPSVVKVSAGATEFLKIAKDKSANNYVRAVQDAGYQVIALDTRGKVDVGTIGEQLADKVLVVIGGEDRSVAQFILNTADLVVSIKQQGKISSLNASVAAGIALFSLKAHRG